MRKLISMLLAVMLICCSSAGLAERFSFYDTISKKGAFYSLDYINNYVSKEYKEYNKFPDDMSLIVTDEVKQGEDTVLSFSLYKLTLLDTEDVTYAVKCRYYSKNNNTLKYSYIEYDEIETVLKALNRIEDYINAYKADSSAFSSSYSLTYISLNGMKFSGEMNVAVPTLIISFDDDKKVMFENADEIEIMINYFANIDHMIDSNEAL